MDRQAAREEINSREPDFLENAPHMVDGKETYICPNCGNGSGEHGTGISRYMGSNGKQRWKCFVCGLNADNIELWKMARNVQDDKEAFQGMYSYYGLVVEEITEDHSGKKSPNPRNQKKEGGHSLNPEAKAGDRISYYRKCASRIGQTDYPQKRGLSEDVIKNFMLGYDPHFRTKDGETGKYTEWKALIIPTGPNSCNVRNTALEAGEKNRYRKRGDAQIYNAKVLNKSTRPIFIVEGELDALSFMSVGAEAIALGGAGVRREFVKRLGTQRPVQPLVLNLDNDGPGKKAMEELAGELDRLQIQYSMANVYGDKKDANAALLANKNEFIQAIAEAEAQAKKEAEDDIKAEREAYMQTSAAGYLQGFIDGIADSVNTPYIPTGFSRLDNALDGGFFEGLYILGGISSVGKTSYVLQIVDQIAEAGGDVLYISLEMARNELISKSVSRMTLMDVLKNNGSTRDAKTARGITTGKRYENYSHTERELITRSIEAYAEYAGHIFILEGIGNIGTAEIRDAVKKHISITGKTPLVVIDYIQILSSADIRLTDKQAMDRNVMELKRISRDFKLPVLGISSFNRSNYREAVTMEAFKESGAIEYSSDCLIGLQLKGAGGNQFNAQEAKGKNPREIETVILKNRNGAVNVTLEFEYYPLFNYFREK